MISTEESMTLQILHKQGYSKRTIFKQLGVSRNTIDKQLSQDDAKSNYHARAEVAHKLDQFKKYINERIESAMPIHLRN